MGSGEVLSGDPWDIVAVKVQRHGSSTPEKQGVVAGQTLARLAFNRYSDGKRSSGGECRSGCRSADPDLSPERASQFQWQHLRSVRTGLHRVQAIDRERCPSRGISAARCAVCL